MVYFESLFYVKSKRHRINHSGQPARRPIQICVSQMSDLRFDFGCNSRNLTFHNRHPTSVIIIIIITDDRPDSTALPSLFRHVHFLCDTKMLLKCSQYALGLSSSQSLPAFASASPSFDHIKKLSARAHNSKDTHSDQRHRHPPPPFSVCPSSTNSCCHQPDGAHVSSSPDATQCSEA